MRMERIVKAATEQHDCMKDAKVLITLRQETMKFHEI